LYQAQREAFGLMSVAPASKEVLEQADILAAWLQQISDEEHWRPYRGSVEIKQCSHPDRSSRVKALIDAGNVEVCSNIPPDLFRY
jgi:hypothetical protein